MTGLNRLKVFVIEIFMRTKSFATFECLTSYHRLGLVPFSLFTRFDFFSSAKTKMTENYVKLCKIIAQMCFYPSPSRFSVSMSVQNLCKIGESENVNFVLT